MENRLSTIANADHIVYIDKGVVVEMGTHSELIKLKGNYYNLIMANMEPSNGERNRLHMIIVRMMKHCHFLEDKSPESIASLESIRFSPHASLNSDKSLESMETLSGEDKVEEEIDGESESMFWRLMRLNMKEWPFIVFGCVASLILGGTLPAFALLFGDIYRVKYIFYKSIFDT